MSAELARRETAPIDGVSIDYGKVLNYLKLNPADPKSQALVLVCRQYGLDPVLKHALLVEGNLYVTRDGLLHVAHSSGQFDGLEVLEQGETDTHWTAKVAVYRKDMSRPFTFVGRFPKLRDLNEWRDGANGKRVKVKIGEEPHPYGPEMAVKCAASMSLRHAFDVAMSALEERWDVDPQPPVVTVERVQESEGRGERAEAETVRADASRAGKTSSSGGEARRGEPATTPSPRAVSDHKTSSPGVNSPAGPDDEGRPAPHGGERPVAPTNLPPGWDALKAALWLRDEATDPRLAEHFEGVVKPSELRSRWDGLGVDTQAMAVAAIIAAHPQGHLASIGGAE